MQAVLNKSPFCHQTWLAKLLHRVVQHYVKARMQLFPAKPCRVIRWNCAASCFCQRFPFLFVCVCVSYLFILRVFSLSAGGPRGLQASFRWVASRRVRRQEVAKLFGAATLPVLRPRNWRTFREEKSNKERVKHKVKTCEAGLTLMSMYSLCLMRSFDFGFLYLDYWQSNKTIRMNELPEIFCIYFKVN